MGYQLVPVEGLGPADVGRGRGISEGGFPDWLRADFGSLLAGRQPGELPLALTEEGRPVGFAMLRPLGPTGWMYLRFFVVDAADEPGTEPEEAQIRRRRIAFYRRHDAAVLPVTGYRTPHDDAGEGPWTPMALMAAGLAAGGPP